MKKIDITPEQAYQKALNNFKSGYNCSQSVALTFCEYFDVPLELMAKLSQPFGGGMGRMREVCGCVSGMFFLVGLVKGSSDNLDKNAKDECYKAVQFLAEEFKKQNKSIICRELLGLVPLGQAEKAAKNKTQIEHVESSYVSEERTAEYYKKRPCAELAGVAASIFCKWLIENNKTE